MTVRTRFAPSPTGYLHIGSVRTALYCWLYARRFNGQFILRIEDTDLERSTPEAVQTILDGMQWLGLDCDEGPYYQTLHFDRYKEVIAKMLADGTAYKCYCRKERLEKLRAEQTANKQKPRYDGLCRDLKQHPEDQSFVVRFRNPTSGEVVVDDKVHGPVTFQNSELDDLIIARSDGTPTYNFTVVVDDWDMKITHVIRGDDHLNNTPRQINMLLALDATPPIYAHLPMILGTDGKKLSKRHGAVSVMQYRDEGFLPEALLNYLVRLGWSHGDQEIFSREELIKYFDITHLNKAAAAFNLEKLLWLNQHYIKTNDPAEIAKQLERELKLIDVDISNGPAVIDVVLLQRERAKTLKEMAEKSRYFYEDEVVQHPMPEESLSALRYLKDQLENITEWTDQNIHNTITTSAEKFDLKMGKLAQPLRLAITGTNVSPSIDKTAQLIGKERVIARLNKTLE